MTKQIKPELIPVSEETAKKIAYAQYQEHGLKNHPLWLLGRTQYLIKFGATSKEIALIKEHA